MSAPISSDPYVYCARAHAKVNLQLGVGDAREDGYHELASVFQSLDLSDELIATETGHMVGPANAGDGLVAALEASGTYRAGVPEDEKNLAWRAVAAVGARYWREFGPRQLPQLVLSLRKGIPAAGGMAGGSADAAAALRIADACFGPHYGIDTLGEEVLHELSADLGSDVPFTLMGGTALGSGRGEVLTEMMARGRFHWAIVTHTAGLSTPAVFATLDRLRAEGKGSAPHLDTSEVSRALISGRPEALAGVLSNDLQPAALSLRPELRTTLEAGEAAGALRGIVSGSGPTCAFLCADEATAREVASQVTVEIVGTRGLVAAGPAPGAYITSVS